MSKRAMELQAHVEIAERVQDLVSLAYDRHLAAHSARVRLEGASVDSDDSWLWHRELSAKPSRQGSDGDRPLFHLADIGPRGVSNWVRLCRQYPDASDAIRARHRAAGTVTARLVQLGAAIEKYVGQNTAERRRSKRLEGWCKKRGKADTYASRLARHAGRPFASFVVDPDKWGRAFTDAYNSAKHPERAGNASERDVQLFNVSAQLLLTCVLLDRAAGSRRPSTTLLADYRLSGLADRMQLLIKTDGAAAPPVEGPAVGN